MAGNFRIEINMSNRSLGKIKLEFFFIFLNLKKNFLLFLTLMYVKEQFNCNKGKIRKRCKCWRGSGAQGAKDQCNIQLE